MIKNIIFIIISILLLLPVLCFSSVTVKSTHPRLFFDATRQAAIITDCEAGGDLRAHYLVLKAYVDESSASSGTAMAVQRYWLSVALCAMVEGGSYLTEIQTQIGTWYTNRLSSTRYSATTIGCIAIIYDWLYSDLTTTDRQNVGDTLLAYWAYWETGSGDYHSTWNNHTMEEVHGVILGGLAMQGDGYVDTEAAAAVGYAEAWIDNELVPAWGLQGGGSSSMGIDGGWCEGQEYSERGGYALWESFKAWEEATGEEILTNSPTFSGLGKWFSYIHRNNNTFVPVEDYNAHTISSLTSSVPVSVLSYMMASEGDTWGRYFWNKLDGGDGVLSGSDGFSDGYRYVYLWYIIFNNSTSPVTIANESKVALFDGLNQLIVKENWTDGVTFFATFDDMYSGHEHFDAGHFEISRSAGLALDAGAYGGGDTWEDPPHEWHYYQRTIAHNVVTVVDSTETWYGSGWDSNDGGQAWPVDWDTNMWAHYPDRFDDFTEAYNQADVLRYKADTNYTYIRGDIQPAYSTKVSFYHREFIIKGNYYIVCDKLTSSSSSYPKRWLLHSETEPTVSGSTTTITNTDKLIIESILPSSQTITKRGGTGYEYWSNYDGTGDNPQPYNNNGEASPNENGNWRIEIAPNSAATNDTFLNVLKAGESSITMPTVNPLSGTGYIGSHIEDSTENIISIFNSAYSSTDNTTVTYTITPTTDSRHIVSGLTPSSTFSVTGLSDQTTDAAGVLEFTDTGTSEKEYVISQASSTHNQGCSFSGASFY